MPRVPILEERSVAPQSSSVRVREGSPMEAAAGSILHAGQQAAGVFAGIAREERARAENAAVLEADNALDEWEQTTLFDPGTGAYNRKGKEAFDLPGQVLPSFDAHAEQLEQGIASDRAKQAFRARRLARRQSISQSLNQHEAGERNAFYDQQDQAKLASSRAMAGNYYSDPARIAQELGVQESTIRNIAARKGWSDDKTNETIATQRSGTHSDVVNRYIARGQWRKGQIYFEEVRDQISGDDGTRIEAALTEERRREERLAKEKLTEAKQLLNDQVRDIAAAAQLGIVPTETPSRESLVAIFGKHEGEQRHTIVQNATKLATAVGELHSLPTADLAKRAEELRPKTAAGAADLAPMYASLLQAAHQIQAQRDADPAGYLAQYSPGVKAAWTDLAEANAQEQPEAAAAYLRALSAAKEDLGIGGHETLPKAYAQSVVERLTAARENETVAQMVAAEAQRWGSAWPGVYRQVQDKLPDVVTIIGSGVSQRAANALASTITLQPEELRARAKAAGTEWSELEQKVDAQLGEFQRTLPDPGATTLANKVRDAAQRATVMYMAQGSSLSEAAKQAAADVANSKYTFATFRGRPYRVPIEIDADPIDDGATVALSRFTAASGTVQTAPGVPEEIVLSQWTEHVRNSGYWVTAPDESGLRLYQGGQPVPGIGGKPVGYTWAELAQIGAEHAAGQKSVREEYEQARREGAPGVE